MTGIWNRAAVERLADRHPVVTLLLLVVAAIVITAMLLYQTAPRVLYELF